MNAAIITAKGNNASIPDKNVLSVGGRPLVAYPIEAAQEAKLIDAVYVSTNCERISSAASNLGCNIIRRPEHLCTSESHHGDTIVHAVKAVVSDAPGLDLVTVLLGNTVMVDGTLIDLSLQILQAHSRFTGVMSVWQAQDDHPYRALEIGSDGCLRSHMDIECGTSRQGYPAIYYYDQGVWSFRQSVAAQKEGPAPWWWMGKSVFPIIRNWVTGRDIHTYLDVDIAAWWVSQTREADILNSGAIAELL